MQIVELSKNEYHKIEKPFTEYNKIEFYEFNKNKVDNVKYLLFSNNKKRFTFVGGIKNNSFFSPFSSSFECFSELSEHSKIEHYFSAISSLIKWGKDNKLQKIYITLPPFYYGYSHISKMANALIANEFYISSMDINFEFYTKNYNDDSPLNIIGSARQKLRKALNKAYKKDLIFKKTEDFDVVYDVIKQNRISKNYALKMSYEECVMTSKIIPTDLFLVSLPTGEPIASAICHRINDKIIRVIYWGNVPNTDDFSPMNFLSKELFHFYYEENKIEIIDIGPSTLEKSIPNFGLCDFKESIGCESSLKISFYKKI